MRLLAILVLGLIGTAVLTNLFHPFHMDFISFWAAAKLALQGHAADAYSSARLGEIQGQVMALGTSMPFGYPPPFLLFIVPAGLLPYGIAAALWIGASYAAYHLAAQKLMPGFGWAIAGFIPILTCGMLGQSAMLLAGISFLAFSLLGTAPFAAGLLLGCLIVKPQLGLLLPLAFLAGAKWKAMIGAAVSTGSLLILAWLLFGTEAYVGFLGSLGRSSSIVADGMVSWHKMVGVYPALRQLGAPTMLAWSLHAVVAIAAAGAMCWIWRKNEDPLGLGAAFSAATMLGSPYLYQYDMVSLLMAFAWLWKQGAPAPLLAGLWLLPLVGFIQNWSPDIPININPIISIGLMILICKYQSAPAVEHGAAPIRQP